MYRPTGRQRPLLDASSKLTAEARERLRRTWAGPFQERMLPLLLAAEGRFADLFCEDNGRPNWSVARRLGLCVLQEMLDLTDQEVLDAFAFDVRFQYALDVEPADAYLSRRSLGDFRSRMVRHDPEMKRLRTLFDDVTDAALGELKLSVGAQRLDSTQVLSNIRTRGRVDLFGKTIRHFLRDLEKTCPDRYGELPPAMREWHARDEEKGDFGKGRPATALQTLAEWAVELARRFEHVEDVASWESAELVRRLVREHCEVVTEEGEPASEPDAPAHAPVVVTVRPQPVNTGKSMQSPFDPDATYGHKGVGYSVQIAETTGNERTEILTDFEVRPAAANDWGQTTPAIERLEEAGRKPDVLFADAGYPTPTALLEAEQQGVTLHSPIGAGVLPDDVVGRDRFEFDADQQVVRCPEGHAPIRHGLRKAGGQPEATMHAFFDGDTCRACPLAGRCVARGGDKGTYAVETRRQLRLRDEALARQRRNEGWWQRYRVRAGIEGTNSELKRKHGLGRLRIRRAPRVKLAVTMKLTACNAKRWINAARSA